MAGTGIETPLRTGFVGVMVLLGAPAIASGEWPLWVGLAKLLCLPERPQEANPRAAGTSSGFGMPLEQVEPHPAAVWGPCGAAGLWAPHVSGVHQPPLTGVQDLPALHQLCAIGNKSDVKINALIH